MASVLGLQACGPAGSGGQTAPLSPQQACLQSLEPASGVDACKQALTASPDDMALRKRIALLRLKAGSLAAARQAYQIVLAANPNDAEAEFGLGLTLEAVGEQNANLKKLEAAQKAPSVIETFRKYGFSDLDLMTFDTAPLVVGGQSPKADRAMTPKQPFTSAVTVSVKCKAGLNGRLHDCAVISPLGPDQAAFGEAAKAIFMTTRVRPASNKGAPVADAPIVLTYVFWPASYYARGG
ncbi:MAG: tetratricopeptide repeat protein [Caulobacteraceae bacterium]